MVNQLEITDILCYIYVHLPQVPTVRMLLVDLAAGSWLAKSMYLEHSWSIRGKHLSILAHIPISFINNYNGLKGHWLFQYCPKLEVTKCPFCVRQIPVVVVKNIPLLVAISFLDLKTCQFCHPCPWFIHHFLAEIYFSQSTHFFHYNPDLSIIFLAQKNLRWL